MSKIKDGTCSMVVREYTTIEGYDHRLCYTDAGQPAIYCEAAFAELFAAEQRDRHVFGTFRVIDFLVL